MSTQATLCFDVDVPPTGNKPKRTSAKRNSSSDSTNADFKKSLPGALSASELAKERGIDASVIEEAFTAGKIVGAKILEIGGTGLVYCPYSLDEFLESEAAGENRRTPQILDRESIFRHPDLRPRDSLDEEVIAEYAALLRAGAKFPPAIVYSDKHGRMLLSEGWHTDAAEELLGGTHLRCLVRPGDIETAKGNSVRANRYHGHRRTNADKRRVTEIAIQLYPHESDRSLAKLLLVSGTHVGRVRKALANESVESKSDSSTASTIAISQLESQIRDEIKETGESLAEAAASPDTVVALRALAGRTHRLVQYFANLTGCRGRKLFYVLAEIAAGTTNPMAQITNENQSR